MVCRCVDNRLVPAYDVDVLAFMIPDHLVGFLLVERFEIIELTEMCQVFTENAVDILEICVCLVGIT